MKYIIKLLLGCFAFMIILFGILVLSIVIHEVGHITLAKGQNISLKLEGINWKPAISGWGTGSVIPTNQEECKKFNNLSSENKQKITHAGIKAELFFISLLLVISISLFIIYHKKLWNNNRTQLLFLTLMILSFLIIIFFILKDNVFTLNPIADWNLLNLSNCSVYS